MIVAQAPGKLFIVGEYAVTDNGQPAVLVAVNRYLQVHITPSVRPGIIAESEYVQAAIAAIDEIRHARKIPAQHFNLAIKSELKNSSGVKFGLGSSGALTVATIDALNQLYKLGLSRMERFKVALLGTLDISTKASGGDIAASTFGGWIRYCSPDREQLRRDRKALGMLAALNSSGWHSLEITQLPPPKNQQLLVGWTGSPASTDQRIAELAQTHTAAINVSSENVSATAAAPTGKKQFFAASKQIVDNLCAGLAAQLDVSEHLRAARQLLQNFAAARSFIIETPTLCRLADIAEKYGAAAKSSGAGGGDCGIALVDAQKSNVAGILREWQQQQISHLNMQIVPGTPAAQGAHHEQ